MEENIYRKKEEGKCYCRYQQDKAGSCMAVTFAVSKTRLEAVLLLLLLSARQAGSCTAVTIAVSHTELVAISVTVSVIELVAA